MAQLLFRLLPPVRGLRNMSKRLLPLTVTYYTYYGI